MTACVWSDCWCRSWPPSRLIPSIDTFYSMAEGETVTENGHEFRTFTYLYLPRENA